MSSFVLLLLFLAGTSWHVRAQGLRECTRITREDLISTANPRQSSILVQTYTTSFSPSGLITIDVEDMHIVCEAVGTTRDTFRYVSVVVRQICSGQLCREETRGASALVQYDFECSTSNTWIPETLGIIDVRFESPEREADFDTETRRDCGACGGRLTGVDTVTHCRACSSGCTGENVLNQCDSIGSGCCNYYFEDECVENCPLDSHKVDEDFNCVEPIECPALTNPLNGTVSVDGNHFYDSKATYECDDGFELDGTETRQCKLNGEWASDAPVCKPVEETNGDDSQDSGISNTELGIVIAVTVLFFLIVAGVFIGFVAVWACKCSF